ncbi:hypothetical protein T09_9248, partial [Trichinella sp. T9]
LRKFNATQTHVKSLFYCQCITEALIRNNRQSGVQEQPNCIQISTVMTPQDIDIIETKQSYSRIHSHRKMHRLLTTL